MSITSELQERVKVAMKAGRKEEVGSLRLVLSELKKAAIDSRSELDADGEVRVLKRERKKRDEAAETFRRAGRVDLAEHEEFESTLIAEYLPEQLDETAVLALIDEAVSETGASSVKDMGKVMANVMGKAGSQVDGKVVSRLVKERLAT